MGGSQAADVAALEEVLSVTRLARMAARASGERSSRMKSLYSEQPLSFQQEANSKRLSQQLSSLIKIGRGRDRELRSHDLSSE